MRLSALLIISFASWVFVTACADREPVSAPPSGKANATQPPRTPPAKQTPTTGSPTKDAPAKDAPVADGGGRTDLVLTYFSIPG